MASATRSIFSIFVCLLILGAGCRTPAPENSAAVAEDSSLVRCSAQASVAELERIFGTGNMTPTEYVSSDPYRTGKNSCAYFGTVVEDKMNYLVTVAVVPDVNQDYFKWEKTEAEVNKTFMPADDQAGLPPGSFYKKLAILPDINFGRAHKQDFSWSLVVHSGGVTYSVTDVPQFAGMEEDEVRGILRSVVNSLIK